MQATILGCLICFGISDIEPKPPILENFFLPLFFAEIVEMKFNANSIIMPPSRYLESGEVSDLSIDLITNNDFGYEFFANGKLTETKLIAENFPVADLSNSNFNLVSEHAVNGDTSSILKTVLELRSESEKPFGIDAVASLAMSGNDIFDCFKNRCVFSNLLLDYNVTAYQDKLNGLFSCQKFPCEKAGIEHELVTNNTTSFFESATNSRVFNPIFLALLYRTLLSGEQVGDGHSFRF